jgi:hypothetical protein
MGEVKNRKRDFLERRDRNMRRRARRRVVSTESATVILLPEDKSKDGDRYPVPAVSVQQAKEPYVLGEKLGLSGSRREPSRVNISFATDQLIFDGQVSVPAYDPNEDSS